MERWKRRASGAALAAIVAWTASTVDPAPAAAQAEDREEEVLRVVERLFDAMRAGDSAEVRRVFHPDARLAGVAPDGGIRHTPVDAFVEAVGRAERELDERFFDPEVRIDGELATVWTEYTLHLDDEFSHCGTDAFTLLRGADGWRIVAIADTRRTEGCERAGAEGDPEAGAAPDGGPEGSGSGRAGARGGP